MPRLWNDTIASHRRAVRDAAIDAASRLFRRGGLAGVTMAAVAAETGVGRATLYRHFPDLHAILAAWHERQVGEHLEGLAAIAGGPGTPLDRIGRVVEEYALASRLGHAGELAAVLHRGGHVKEARARFAALLAGLVEEGIASGEARAGLDPAEAAAFCLGAAEAAAHLPSVAAAGRIADMAVAALAAGGHGGSGSGSRRSRPPWTRPV